MRSAKISFHNSSLTDIDGTIKLLREQICLVSLVFTAGVTAVYN